MSLATKLLSRKSTYLLEVEETSALKNGRKNRLGLLSGLGRKITAVSVALIIGGSGAAAGFMSYTAATPAASADWVSDIVCIQSQQVGGNGDVVGSILGLVGNTEATNLQFTGTDGASTAMKDAKGGMLSQEGFEEILGMKIMSSKTQQTAYEQFTFFPEFEAWTGAYDHSQNTAINFYGTRGKATASNPYYVATNPTQIGSDGNHATNPQLQPLFSHSFADCVNPVKSYGVQFANNIFLLSKYVTTITNQVYGWSASITNSDPKNPLYTVKQQIANIIAPASGKGGLKDDLFLTYLAPLVMIGAIGLFYRGVVKNGTVAASQSALWMILAAIAGLVFVSKPLLIPDALDTVVTNFQTAMSATIEGTASLNGHNMCTIDGKATQTYSYVAPNTIAGAVLTGDVSKLAGTTNPVYVREVQCNIWYATIYSPWVAGQFGVANDSQSSYLTRDPRGVLASTTIHLGNTDYVLHPKKGGNQEQLTWPIYEMYNQQVGRAFNISEVAFSQLTNIKSVSGSTPTAGPATGSNAYGINGVWAGGDLTNTVGTALLSLMVSFASEIFVLISACLLIGYQFSMIFLIALSPIFLLAGVAPGWGRRVLMRWFELLVEIFIKRIMLFLILALFLKFFTIIVETDAAYFFKVLAVIIVSFVALFQRKRLTDIFVDAISFGGNKRILTGETGAAAKNALGKTAAAAVGIGITAVTAGAGAPVGAAMAAKAGATVVGAAGKKAVAAGAAGAVAGAAPAAGGPAVAAAAGATGAAEALAGGATEVLQTVTTGRGKKGVAAVPTVVAPVASTKLLDGIPENPAVRPVAAAPAVAVPTAGTPAVPDPSQVNLDELNRRLRRKAIRDGAILGLQNGINAGKINASFIFKSASQGLALGKGIRGAGLDEISTQVAQQRAKADADQRREEYKRDREEGKRHQDRMQELAERADKREEDRTKKLDDLSRTMDDVRRTSNRTDRKLNTQQKTLEELQRDQQQAQRQVPRPTPQAPVAPPAQKNDGGSQFPQRRR